ncbi:serine/threonine protein kinase [Candidatus Bathyarchaeota archaeon]|nr:serine/threonine protein kinase [Candidatus Bathyarchaeota archaeon]
MPLSKFKMETERRQDRQIQMSDGRWIDKAEAAERRMEERDRMLTKRQEDYKVIEEVFDLLTVEGIDKLMRRGTIKDIEGVIKAGKEARVYWGIDPEDNEIAIKIYYTTTADFRKGMLKYIEGDRRFKRVKRTPRGLVYAWTQKEFKNLQLAEKAGVNSPKPKAFNRNILVMSFIGEDGVPAPLLREIAPEDPNTFYLKLLAEAKLLYTKAGVVHGDLSEYNIMIWKEAPIIFDVSQALLIEHALAEPLLKRDISNINTYFNRLGVDVINSEEVERWVKGESEDLS